MVSQADDPPGEDPCVIIRADDAGRVENACRTATVWYILWGAGQSRAGSACFSPARPDRGVVGFIAGRNEANNPSGRRNGPF
jgi:hypothetical protein